jgi:hypothetical protein
MNVMYWFSICSLVILYRYHGNESSGSIKDKIFLDRLKFWENNSVSFRCFASHSYFQYSRAVDNGKNMRPVFRNIQRLTLDCSIYVNRKAWSRSFLSSSGTSRKNASCLIVLKGRPHTYCVKISIKTWDKRRSLASFVIRQHETDVSIMTQTGVRRFS